MLASSPAPTREVALLQAWMGTLRDIPRKVAEEEAGNHEGAHRSIAALPLALCFVALGADDPGASRALLEVDALAPYAVGQERPQVTHVAIVPGVEHDGGHAWMVKGGEISGF